MAFATSLLFRWRVAFGLSIGVQILDADPPGQGVNIAGRMTSETHYSKLLTARHDDPSRTDATVSLISRVSLRRASLLG